MVTMMRNERVEDKPPFSRLFVVCNKQFKEDDLRPEFEAYGTVEELFMPTDKTSGEPKGIAYVKFSKTSSAAAAIEGLHMKRLANSHKPIKVMVASQKNDDKNENGDQYKRLFVKVPIDASEREIEKHFSQFGNAYVMLQRDRATQKCKGFGYIKFDTFLEASNAYEQCDRSYKPIFAIPKDDLKRSRHSNYVDRYPSSDSIDIRDNRYDFIDHSHRDSPIMKDSIISLIKTAPKDFDAVIVNCNPYVPQKSIEMLFNVIPGMIQFKYSVNQFTGMGKALIKYDSKIAAAHALETLNNYEFPSGQIISVKPDDNPINKVASNLTNVVNNFKNSLDSNSDLKQLADAIAQASTLLQVAASSSELDKSNDSLMCNVRLPPVKPMASPDSRVVQRCFLVFKPHTLPLNIVRDAFCRFGDLIDVVLIPNKTFGFAKYASEKSAQDAMTTLNGAMLHGVQIKVLEAQERPSKDVQNLTNTRETCGDAEYNTEKKRAKLSYN